MTRSTVLTPAELAVRWKVCPVCGRSFDSLRALRSHRGKMDVCSPSLAEAFWRHVDSSGGVGCWLWTGSTQRGGYGRLWWRGRSIKATHAALDLDGRPLQPGQMALHSCYNPPCVNPAHLFAMRHRVAGIERPMGLRDWATFTPEGRPRPKRKRAR